MKKFEVTNLTASISGKPILCGVTFTVRPGEVHVIMGPNGSGKSTLAQALVGRSGIEVEGVAKLDGKNILTWPPDQRARAGLFLSFQSPVAIPGVSVVNILREAVRAANPQARGVKTGSSPNPVFRLFSGIGLSGLTGKITAQAEILGIKKELLSRGVNDGFSGGERKKIEILQALVLSPRYAIFDEIDTGLDIDALKSVAKGIKVLAKAGAGVIVITHYQRIMNYLPLDYVHVFINGKIVRSGTRSLMAMIEKSGYQKLVG
jgi:Fe-S cluster assembly ATP-binding protein